MAKRFKAAILGGSGYGGGELIRRLLRHPDVELARVVSVDFNGEPLSAAHPHLEGITDLVFEKKTAKEAADGMDVVLLGLPHKVSATAMPDLLASGARIVDLSGDFRLRDAALYKKFYHADHPCASRLLDGTFVYGLPELNREAIKKAHYVASPGCFATTIELALLPLAKKGWLDGNVEVVGITGSSGSGVTPSAGTHHPVRSVNLRTYKPLDHQHIPEVEQTLRDAGAKGLSIRFVPVSAPLSRGIFVTCFAHIQEAVTAEQVSALYKSTFKGEPFVRVPERRLPEVAAVSGTNFAEVGAHLGTDHAEPGKHVIACFAATDNLIKGGAGQAIQSMNLMLGIDERTTLEDPGGWP
jgi:N-acetyl-gamma-glutamyl-phosphate reductase